MTFQKQVRLIHGVRTQDSRKLITRESKYMGGFRDAGNILFLDLGAGYTIFGKFIIIQLIIH